MYFYCWNFSSYDYKDGERTTNINGYKYSVALPKLRFEKISIKVPLEKKNTPLFDINSENPIPTGIKVGFKNIEVKSYFSNGNINVTASADDVFVIKEWKNEEYKWFLQGKPYKYWTPKLFVLELVCF